MKILLVHCHYRMPGGEDAVFAAERALLERRGHQVIVYERSNEEAAHGLPKALLPLHAVWNHAAARDIKHIIKTQNIDAVHIHNTLLLLSPAVVRAAKSTGVPVVQTLHNFRLFCPNGILLRDGRVCEDCPRHGLSCAIRHRCYRGSLAQTLVVAAAYGLHRRLGTWRGVTMVALTEFDRQKLLEFNRQYPMFDADRLVVKPNPVCVPSGPVNPWGDRKNQMLFAGRLEELKGLRTVLEAWRLLGDAAPALLVAGEGPLGDWARAQNLPNVQFLGQLPRAELHARMAESRAVVAASLCYESFALVPAEAHALGTPVLASGLGNVGASVQPGFDGLCFAPGDANALAGAVRAFGKMSFDCNAIAARARRTYSEDENYNALMRFYTKGTSFTALCISRPNGCCASFRAKKRSTPSPCAPCLRLRAPTRCPPWAAPPTPCCPPAPASGTPTRCSTTGTTAAGSTPRPWTWPQVSAASRSASCTTTARQGSGRSPCRRTSTSPSPQCLTGTARPG